MQSVKAKWSRQASGISLARRWRFRPALEQLEDRVVPAAPVAVDDLYFASAGTTLNIALAGGVLSNDTDADGDTLTAQLVSGPSNGTLSLNSNGSFTFSPAAGFSGVDSFSYRARDASLNSNLATATIQVQPLNTVFPGASWDVRTPGEVGMDAAKLQSFITAVGGTGVVIKDGYLVSSWGTGTRADWASSSKPVTSTLLFFAVEEGRIASVDSLVRPWVQQLFPGQDLLPKDQAMTWRHLADMISGYARGEAAGTRWAYNDYAINLYKKLLYNAVFQDSANNVAMGRLAALQFQDGGIFGSRSGFGINPTPRDFARIGWFWLNRGNWNGAQILPRSYFDNYMKADVPAGMPRTTTAGTDYLGVGTHGGGSDQGFAGQGVYGFNWWFNSIQGAGPGAGQRFNPDLPDDAFFTIGHEGLEVMVIIPSLNLVAAARGNWGGTNLPDARLLVEAVNANSAPVASADSYSTTKNKALTVAATGLLANDSDANGDALTASLVSGPANGSVTLNSNGSFTYTPNNGFVGTDSFVYRASDGSLFSNNTTVSINVNATSLPGQIIVDPANPAHLVYNRDSNADGKLDPVFIAGPGDPEGFLYRGTRNADGTRSGDQTTLINKLIANGGNSIYMQIVRSHGGDGAADHNPFVNSDPAQGLDADILNQWETWFTAMDNAGIVIYLFFYDDSARIWIGDTVGSGESAFIQGIVNRFEHHKNLIWVVAEEYQEAYSAARVSDIAATIRAADNHDHVIAVHHATGDLTMNFPTDPNIDEFSLQTSPVSVADLHADVLTAVTDANGRFHVNMSEAHPYHANLIAAQNWTELRQSLWAVALTGTDVMVLGDTIATTPTSVLGDYRRLQQFMESTPFNTMAPRDDLAFAATQYVLANPGQSYIAYASSLSGNIGLKGMTAGTYTFMWFDAVNGTTVTQSLSVGAGDQSWAKPSTIGAELAVYINLTGSTGNTAPTANNQSVTTTTGTAVGITLSYSDPDGPGPYTFTIVSGPANGTLTGSGASRTYTPSAGFSGSDSFTWRVHDGQADSNIANVSITVSATGETVLFSDNFDRANSSTVGNGWVELEASGALVEINSNKLFFLDTSDVVNRPLVKHGFSKVTAGQLVWEFDFDWRRSGSEGDYRLFMQLGDSAGLSDSSQSSGVGVNLVWTAIGGLHERLGVIAGGTTTALTGLSGAARIRVAANLDNHTYDVSVNGVTVGSGIAFSSLVGLDTVRFFTDGVNEVNFAGRTFDNVVVKQLSQSSNVPPTAQNSSVTTPQGTQVYVQLVIDDPDGPGPYTYTIVSGPSNGTLTGSNNDRFYTPNPGFTGSDSFTWKVNDGLADSNIATVSITVTSTNAPPTAVNDSYTVAEDGTLTVSATAGVLANDSDPDGDPLTASLVTGPTKGSLSLNANGSFTYTPNANFNGSDAFTYRASDGQGGTATATVSITVTAVNDAPVAAADSYSLTQDTMLTVAAPGLLANDSDVDGDPLTASLVSGPANGTVTVNSNGSFSYTPNAGFVGGDSFTYQASDGQGGTANASVSITVTAASSDLSVNVTFVSTGKTLGVVDLAVGALVYVDRTFTITGFSAGLAGGTLIQTANNDKSVTAAEYLRFNINQDAKVYVGYDRRSSSRPGWLSAANGWAASSETLSDNDGAGNPSFLVYEKSFAAGDVSLGGNLATGAAGASSNYAVVVKGTGAAANQAPTVATAASGSPNPVGGVTTNLSVLGADDGGEANLIYTWLVTAKPQAAADPTFSVNGTNAAKNTTATLSLAGSYTFTVTIRDAAGLSTSSSVGVTVNQTLTSIVVSPASVTLSNGQTQQFSATARDQFGNALSTAPTFTWTIAAGGIGTISSNGLYTAPASGSGSATVRATSGTVSGTAAVTVTTSSTVLVSDTFNRANSATVGNGWVELEASGAVVDLTSNQLFFRDTSDVVNRPLVRRAFTTVSAGTLEWTFDFNWKRSGSEKDYRLFMQLGDGALMSDSSQDAGVGVNLIWTLIGGVHERLGSRKGGVNTGLATVSGTASIKVLINLDARTYSVLVNGSPVGSNITFENLVSLNTVRFLTDGLNEVNFSGRTFDNVVIQQAGAPLLAADGEATTSSSKKVTKRKLKPIIKEAKARWVAAGADPAAFEGIRFRITNLPTDMLGYTAGLTIWIDRNAAGHGWYIDQTPKTDTEFSAGQGPNRIDLLSAVLHELGHGLGFDHDHGAMSATLAKATRISAADLAYFFATVDNEH